MIQVSPDHYHSDRAIIRNDDQAQCDPCFRQQLVIFPCWCQVRASYRKTSYCKISWSFETVRFVLRLAQLLWNLTDTSAAMLLICLSNFRAIGSFTGFGSKTSYRLVNRCLMLSSTLHWGKCRWVSVDKRNSIAKALELHLSCTKPSIFWVVSVGIKMFTIKETCLKHNYTPRFNEVERGVYWYHLVRLSVCGQNRVRSVS